MFFRSKKQKKKMFVVKEICIKNEEFLIMNTYILMNL